MKLTKNYQYLFLPLHQPVLEREIVNKLANLTQNLQVSRFGANLIDFDYLDAM